MMANARIWFQTITIIYHSPTIHRNKVLPLRTVDTYILYVIVLSKVVW